MELNNLKKKAFSGVFLLGARRIVFQLIATIANIFLARLLFPSDFGTFATLMFIFTAGSIFSDIGFGPAIIQKKRKITDYDRQSIFTVQLSLTLVIYLGLYLLSPHLIGFFKLPEAAGVLLQIYSLILFTLPFKTIGTGLLERELAYKKLIFIELIEESIIAASSVLFAFWQFGVASFVYGAILGKAVAAILYYYFKPFKIKFAFYKQRLVEFLHFGFSYQVNLFFGIFYGPLIFLYLSKAVGAESMGYFQFAQNLAVAPLAIPELFTRVTFPTTARLQGNKKLLPGFVEKTILITTTMSFPVSMLLLLLGESIISYLYTDKWLPSLPALYLGVLTFQIISFTSILSVLLLGFGKVRIIRNISIFWAFLTWMFGPFLIHTFGFWGMSLTALIVASSGLWLIIPVKKEISFSIVENMLPPFVSFVLTSIFLVLSRSTITSFMMLIKLVIFAVFFYFFCVFLTLRKRFLKELILPIIDIFNQDK